jgi:hypothetical protein
MLRPLSTQAIIKSNNNIEAANNHKPGLRFSHDVT